MVTVYRPDFDEQGNRVSPSTEVKAQTMEVGRKTTEVGRKTTEVGQKSAEVGRKPDFDVIMKDYRKDFRATCASVWDCLSEDNTLPRSNIAHRLTIAESTAQSALNALREVGLLKVEGYGKGRKRFVMIDPLSENSDID